jgi:hypothetical protein
MHLGNTWMRLALTAGLVLGSQAPAAAAGRGAADEAKQLTSAMTERQLDVVAAADPENPNRYVAAMLIPGAQLLVVAAEYPNASELQALIGQRQYRDVYSALHQPSAQPTRLFFLDAGCDGVQVNRETVDVLYEKGTNQVVFDGDWKKAKLSETQYQRKVQEAAEQYGRLLTVLRNSMPPAVAAR